MLCVPVRGAQAARINALWLNHEPICCIKVLRDQQRVITQQARRINRMDNVPSTEGLHLGRKTGIGDELTVQLLRLAILEERHERSLQLFLSA